VVLQNSLCLKIRGSSSELLQFEHQSGFSRTAAIRESEVALQNCLCLKIRGTSSELVLFEEKSGFSRTPAV